MEPIIYKSKFTQKDEVVYPWKQYKNEKLIPFALRDLQKVEWKPVKHNINPRPYQIPILHRSIETLRKQHCLFLALHCGFGKTKMATMLLCEMGLFPALILTPGNAIATQFINTIKEDTKLSVSSIGNELTFSDINVATLQLLVIRNYTKEELSRYKVVIVDEAITACTQKRNDVLVTLSPQCMIGMCADVDRDDGFDKLLDMHYGHRNNWIIADNPHEFTLYKITTRYQPDVRFNYRTQKIDWGTVLKSLALHEKRNKDIIDIVHMCKGDKVMVLTKSVEQCDILYDMLSKDGVNVQKFYKDDECYYNCDVLLTTYSKSTRGLDDANVCPNTDGRPFRVAVLCSDTRKIKQLAGRVQRSKNPIIFYFVDDMSSLRKHWDELSLEITNLKGNIINLYI